MPDRVVLDANVLVAVLYEHDSLHSAAVATIDGIEKASRSSAILDFLLLEALSVLGRRARERKTLQPRFDDCVEQAKAWRAASAVRDMSHLFAVHWAEVLGVMGSTGGKLNANDALLVVLQRAGLIAEVATFDENLAAFPGFKRFA